jgi:sugar lactone lactonase YvrE
MQARDPSLESDAGRATIGLMNRPLRIAVAFTALACNSVSAADTLYMASIRSPIGGDPNVVGNLYIVDPGSGAAKVVAPLRVGGTMPVGVTGLAFHPVDGTLYGVTALLSPNYPHYLLRIDPVTGNATAIGDLGAAGSDISFDKDGRLLVWMRESRQLGVVNLATGVAAPLGPIGPPDTVGGLTLDSRGTAYLAATGATGSLDTVDTKTGLITKGVPLKGAPYPNGINSLTISRDDEIYAVNTNMGNPASTLLVRIDARTGAITKVGPLPSDSDALAFRRSERGDGMSMAWILGAIAALLAIGIVAFVRSRRKPPATAAGA